MAFDPTSPYTTTTDVEGNLFFFQYPYFYDRYGNQSLVPARSHNGNFNSPHRNAPMATLVVPILAGQLPFTLTASETGIVLDVQATGTLTVPPGLSNYSCIFLVPSGGTLTIAAGAGVLLNGAGTSITRTQASNPAGFALIPTSVANSYLVGGS